MGKACGTCKGEVNYVPHTKFMVENPEGETAWKSWA
jgi:hypothetical protein